MEVCPYAESYPKKITQVHTTIQQRWDAGRILFIGCLQVVEVGFTNFSVWFWKKTLKKFADWMKIVAPPTDLVQNDAGSLNQCFFL